MKKTLFTVFFAIPLFLAFAIPITIAGGVLGAYVVYSRTLPEIPELDKYQPKTVSTFYSDNGTVIGIFYHQKRFVVELNQIPKRVINAFLAAEDSRFFQHSGVDWRGFARAMLLNVKARKIVQGGSTITMQVTRNFLLTRMKKISRKFKEIILARRLEKEWGKEKILYVYLNEIYLGEGCYGIEAAARNYFDKPVEHLTVAEAALIAGLVASPSVYNPFKSEKKAKARQREVLRRMHKKNLLNDEQYENALDQKLVFRKEVPSPFDIVPDFAEVVRRYVIKKYGAERLYNEGLKVFTTCRVDYQNEAVEAVKKGLDEIRKRNKHFSIIRTITWDKIPEILKQRPTPKLKEGKSYQGIVMRVTHTKGKTVLRLALSDKLPGRVELDRVSKAFKPGNLLQIRFDKFVDGIPHFKLDDNPTLQAALVMIENRTGFVRAVVGGASNERFKFNRAIQARRQPGSAFKPLIYAVALEKKSYSPATIIIDEPIEVDFDSKEDFWKPKNSGGKFLGPLSFRRALELSRNTCTVKLLMDTGLDPVIRTAREMGITSPLGRNLSLSLGTSELTLFELTAAYTVFPNSGVYLRPVFVKRIEDRFGNVLEDNSEVPLLDQRDIPTPRPREELAMPAEFDANRGGAPGIREETVGPEQENERLTEPDTSQISDADAKPEPESTNPGPGNENPVEESAKADLVPADDAHEQPKPRVARAAMSPQTAYVMTNLLQGGVRHGTGARLNRFLKRRDLAGKTGTTNNAEDAWFVGFNNDFTTGVWVGFDEKRPLGKKEYGSRAALPIWGYFMKEVLEDKPQRDFPVPPDITFARTLTYTGNTDEGFRPQTVVEPIYDEFVGRTLVLSPADTAEKLSRYTPEYLQTGNYPPDSYQAPNAGAVGPSEAASGYPPPAAGPAPPGATRFEGQEGEPVSPRAYSAPEGTRAIPPPNGPMPPEPRQEFDNSAEPRADQLPAEQNGRREEQEVYRQGSAVGLRPAPYSRAPGSDRVR